VTVPLKTRILLADDHEVVRNGLRMVLDSAPDLEVVADGRHKVLTRDLQAFSAWEHRGNSACLRRFARERART
jgi:hypothetical protein